MRNIAPLLRLFLFFGAWLAFSPFLSCYPLPVECDCKIGCTPQTHVCVGGLCLERCGKGYCEKSEECRQGQCCRLNEDSSVSCHAPKDFDDKWFCWEKPASDLRDAPSPDASQDSPLDAKPDPPCSSAEVCDGLDNDCDGKTDEGCQCQNGDTRPCYTGLSGTQGVGLCKAGTQTCTTGRWGACTREVKPTNELCDGKDNDCDGSIDEGLTRPCSTACGAGTEHCTAGGWGECSAPKPTAELCNGIDDNCDGRIDEVLTRSCYTGPSGTQGIGLCKAGTQTCTAGRWGACTGEVKPTNELCNNQDDDCDGKTDEDFPLKDQACAVGIGECSRQGIYVCLPDGSKVHCNVTLGTPRPEICDGKDNNCDGYVDETWPTKGQPCAFGVGECLRSGTFVCNAAQTAVQCSVTAGTPKAEACDGLDNDCDGQIDETFPTKGQSCAIPNLLGVCSVGTYACDQGRLRCLRHNWPSNEACDGLDNDCDGKTDEGCQCKNGQTRPCGSNTGECRQGTETCVSGQWGFCTGGTSPAAEVCDGKDNDCDGSIDENNPGGGASCSTGQQGVCSIGTVTCQAGLLNCVPLQKPTTELCDGLDNDCDGSIDENNPGSGGSCSTGQQGFCSTGTLFCQAGRLNCVAPVPRTELCNGIDDNCDGRIDEVLTRSCYTGPSGTQGIGLCKAGTQTCTAGQWGFCTGETTPNAELCDSLDNNCDGRIDDGNPGGGALCSTGFQDPCATGTVTCQAGSLNCVPFQRPSPEVCDNKDNDCNGLIDDGDPGGGAPCTSGRLGVCSEGRLTCQVGRLNCVPLRQPSPEVCDGLDNDCNGLTDEAFPLKGRVCTEGLGECKRSGTFVCNAAQTNVRCSATAGPPSPELCDGLDNDCDGRIDEAGCALGHECNAGVCKPCVQPEPQACPPTGSLACVCGSTPVCHLSDAGRCVKCGCSEIQPKH